MSEFAAALVGFMLGVLVSVGAFTDARNDWIEAGGFTSGGRLYLVTPMDGKP